MRVPQLARSSLSANYKRWRVTELALFSSVVGDDFGPDSNVDVLVSFDPEAWRTLFDIDRMQDELSER